LIPCHRESGPETLFYQAFPLSAFSGFGIFLASFFIWTIAKEGA